MLIRQGDVFIEPVKTIPDEAKTQKLPHGTLVHGEITGHSHRLEDLATGQLYGGTKPGEMFLDIFGADARIVHEEHGAIALKNGAYRVWRQREYSPEAIRHVYD
jgi:hypothetical protein